MIIFTIIITIILVYITIYYNRVTYYKKLSYDRDKTPKDYGFSYEKESYITKDKKKLFAWYIKAEKKSKKTILLVHGREYDSVKVMKYLELLDTSFIRENYNILIPDMRNSGRSDSSRTYLGYGFAQDIKASLDFLEKKYGVEDVIIYSFSMGAMATVLNVENNLIKKIILDSPLVNVEKILLLRAKEKNVPKVLMEFIVKLIKINQNYDLKELKAGKLLLNNSKKILIMQSKKDRTTPYDILIEEIENLSNIKFVEFDKGLHADTYFYSTENKKMYREKFYKFIE